MSEADFGFFGASAASIKKGVSAGFTPPNGGSNFVFGFHSQTAGDIAAGAYYNTTDFAPLRNDSAEATGGRVEAALKRGTNGYNATGYSVALFCCLQGASIPGVNEAGYLLGLSDEDPSFIVLAKGMPQVPLKAGSSGLTILATSSTSFSWDTWLHLRLDTIVNPNGDVVLNAFKNDLSSHAVTAPVWETIPGISTYIDDALGVNTGSNPLAGGYGGYVFQSSEAYRHCLVDQFAMTRQT